MDLLSCAAALAVLDVLEDEAVLARVAAAGEALVAALRLAVKSFRVVGEVRSSGLAIGVELVVDAHNGDLSPNQGAAANLKRGLRKRRVLVGQTGPHENVVKVRPPLAFTVREVPLLVGALVSTLREMDKAQPPTARL